MLLIAKYSNGKNQSFDLHDQPIGDTYCHKLNGPDLYRAMRKIGIADIDIRSGWMDLALKYAEFRAAQRDKESAA